MHRRSRSDISHYESHLRRRGCRSLVLLKEERQDIECDTKTVIIQWIHVPVECATKRAEELNERSAARGSRHRRRQFLNRLGNSDGVGAARATRQSPWPSYFGGFSNQASNPCRGYHHPCLPNKRTPDKRQKEFLVGLMLLSPHIVLVQKIFVVLAICLSQQCK
jgi:hypothetical protein